MKYNVVSRSTSRKELIEVLVNFFIKELKLTKSKYLLTVVNKSGARKDHGMNGCTITPSADERDIVMFLDNRLTVQQIIETIAHEMVHVKQIARGQLKEHKAKNGRIQRMWMGKIVKKGYYDRPWEIEAYGKERVLANRVVKILQQK